MRDTRIALRRWNDHPWPVVRAWTAGAVAVACMLLAGVLAVASIARPDPTGLYIAGISFPPGPMDVAGVLLRNSLVLALHATACVAGFIAGSSLPLSASRRSGLSRWVHEKAGPLAIGFVICATTFSLCTQAYVIGGGAAALATQLGTSPAVLLLALAPHAIPELFALFLPLAAWIIASRAGDWQ